MGGQIRSSRPLACRNPKQGRQGYLQPVKMVPLQAGRSNFLSTAPLGRKCLWIRKRVEASKSDFHLRGVSCQKIS
jgi:hypothetical protein